MLEREPNRYDDLKKAEAAEKQRREQDAQAKKSQRAERNIVDDTEERLAAYERLLDEKVEKRQITPQEKGYELRKFANYLNIEIEHGVKPTLDFPRPQTRSERQQVIMDPRRDLTDLPHRRETARKLIERQAARLEEHRAQTGEPERPMTIAERRAHFERLVTDNKYRRDYEKLKREHHQAVHTLNDGGNKR